jgi:hypothetical protein
MEKRFAFVGTLTEIYDKVDELNKQGKNARVYYGPFVRDVIEGEVVYEALILQMKE